MTSARQPLALGRVAQTTTENCRHVDNELLFFLSWNPSTEREPKQTRKIQKQNEKQLLNRAVRTKDKSLGVMG